MPYLDQGNACFSSDLTYSSSKKKKKEWCGSAFVTPCSILLFLLFYLFFSLFGVSSPLLPPHLQDSVRMLVLFLPFRFVPRGVCAVADPFLKTTVTKAGLIFTWQNHKPFCLWNSLAAACASRGVGRRKMRRDKFCPYGSVLLQILSMEVISPSTERQTSLREKNHMNDLLSHPASKFSATQRQE